MVGLRESAALRSGAHPDGRPLSLDEREALLKPYLPSDTSSADHSAEPSPVRQPAQKTPPRKKPMRDFLRQQLYLVTYLIIQALFSLYVRLRTAYHAVGNRIYALLYYHHRSPELIQKDLKDLDRLPQHLSIILDFNDDEQRGAGLEGLVNDISEVAAWCASAGIPALSIYERTGTSARRGFWLTPL